MRIAISTITLLTVSALALAATTKPAAGPEDWVGPMKKVHARFTGQPGTVAQLGDSITITMAFFTPLSMDVKNPGDLAQAHTWVRSYVQGRCWRAWKGAAFGNEGRTTSEWGLGNVGGWLKKLNPEVALVMWGTNDTYLGPRPPKYTDNLRAIIQKCLDNGTVPILYTIPPVGNQAGSPERTAHIESFVAAARTVAAEKKVPLVDFYKEIMTRCPTDFAKKLLGDNLHPSYPAQYQRDFSAEALKNSGYTLRNYLTLKKYWEVHQKVLSKVKSARTAASVSSWKGPTYKGLPAVLIPKADRPPKVDGKLTDAVWKKCKPIAFRLLDGDPRKPNCPTYGQLVATEQALYVAFRCTDPQPGSVFAKKRERDENVWEDDSVEVFLLPGARPSPEYYQLIMNPEGSHLDSLARKAEGWNPKVKIATGTSDDGWSVEVEIPFSQIKLPEETPRLAGPWRLNLTRNRPARSGGFAEESALSPSEDPSSHKPEKFAYAFLEVFGGKLPKQEAK